MGAIANVKKELGQGGSGPDCMPWFMASGLYCGKMQRVSVAANDTGPNGTYTLTMLAGDEQAAAGGCPNPLENPDIVMSLDANDEAQKRILFAILGVPMQDGAVVKWDDSGIIGWNGYTDDRARFSREIEFKITATPPNKKAQGAGYWPARYKVDDVDRPGAGQQTADSLATSLAMNANKPQINEPHEHLPPVKAAGRRSK